MKNFYIGERGNPQFKKPYYVAYGELTKKEAKSKQNCVYGSMFLTSYKTKESYEKTISNLKEKGFNVNIR
jgi:hypothetical protein